MKVWTQNQGPMAFLTRRGLGARRMPVPSFVYISSALPAFGKHKTLHRGESMAVLLEARPGNHAWNAAGAGAGNLASNCSINIIQS